MKLVYTSTNRPKGVDRGSMDFYTEKTVHTSDSKDYYRKKGTGRPTKKDRRDIDDYHDASSWVMQLSSNLCFIIWITLLLNSDVDFK